MPNPDKYFSAIIVAGGSGSRFSSTESKTMKLLYGMPVVEYSVQAFQQSNQVSEMILVGQTGTYSKNLLTLYPKLKSIVPGGKTRTESVKNGIKVLSPNIRYVFIHDAARPLLEPAFIDQMADTMLQQSNYTGIFPVLPLYDALKSLEIEHTPKSIEVNSLIRTQTPQLFHLSRLKKAFNDNIITIPFRDEIELLEYYYKDSAFLTIPGSYQLEKITTLQEWHLIESLVQKEERIGIGVDFHYFMPGRDLILGGLHIPGHYGLEGDSDGDVYTHSILEALLGALSLGDMGTFFGLHTPSVMHKKSTSFIQVLLSHKDFKGVQIKHIDTTIIGKEPILKTWIPEMEKNICEMLSISENQINIKSTTDKGMDAAGEGKGIRCITVVLLDRIRRSYAR